MPFSSVCGGSRVLGEYILSESDDQTKVINFSKKY